MRLFLAYRMLLQGDARIWSFATLHGLAAGAVWSFMGFVVYAFVKMFRLGP